jgi:hypothetical protein
VQLVSAALERLRQMFDVLCYSTQRFELQDINEHLRRIFDLVLSSNICEIFGQLLDSQDDFKISPIKLEVLRVISLMSTGARLFQAQSDISIVSMQDDDSD